MSPAIEIFGKAVLAPNRVPLPLHFRQPFFKLPAHTLPVKWSLYRSLLGAAPNDRHRQAVRDRWRDPKRRNSTSPSQTIVRLKEEAQWLREYQRSMNRSRQADAGHDDTPKPTSRVRRLDRALQTRDKQKEREELVQKEYDQALARNAYHFHPKVTPGFLYPSLSNPALPRLKPQPLHITMPIVKRRKVYDRRMPKQRSWEEMLMHIRHEATFERDLGVVSEGSDNVADIKSVLESYKESFKRDFQRAKSKFTVDTLAQANAARARRPSVLTKVARKREVFRTMEGLLDRLNSDGK